MCKCRGVIMAQYNNMGGPLPGALLYSIICNFLFFFLVEPWMLVTWMT
jgi:hypothetical protein